jgi:hypothetical protein
VIARGVLISGLWWKLFDAELASRSIASGFALMTYDSPFFFLDCYSDKSFSCGVALHDRPRREVRISVESEFITTINRSTGPQFERGWTRGPGQFAGTARRKPTASGCLSLILSWNSIKAKMMPNMFIDL